MSLKPVKLHQGIHVMHLFYRVDRLLWSELDPGESRDTLKSVEAFLGKYPADCEPRADLYVNVGGKADLAVILYSKDLAHLSSMHREFEAAFPPGCLELTYNFLSITELSEYTSSEEEYAGKLVHEEKLEPGSEAYEARLAEIRKKLQEYAHYRLYPEMQRWEIMCFYPMLKRREGQDNWYSLSFEERKRLMGGHARVGRKYAGKISQLITSCTGVDDYEWGVTLMAHQLDDVRDIVYEMRFDEVTARFGGFGPFYINLHMSPAEAWGHLGL